MTTVKFISEVLIIFRKWQPAVIIMKGNEVYTNLTLLRDQNTRRKFSNDIKMRTTFSKYKIR